MSANPHANGGLLLRTCACRTSATTPSTCRRPAGDQRGGDARARALPARRDQARTRTTSGSSGRTRPPRTGWAPSSRSPTASGGARSCPTDDHLAPQGRVMEMLSEHQCQGWLEGYLLTGRHGLFNCYEAFIHIVDSMFNQHAKWLKVTGDLAWRRPIASLNYLLTLARLAPGPQRLLATRTRASSTTSSTRRPRSSGSTCRPTPTRLLSVADHCLRSRHYVNVIVAGKQPGAELAADGPGDRALHPRASASGSGPATTAAASRTW